MRPVKVNPFVGCNINSPVSNSPRPLNRTKTHFYRIRLNLEWKNDQIPAEFERATINRVVNSSCSHCYLCRNILLYIDTNPVKKRPLSLNPAILVNSNLEYLLNKNTFGSRLHQFVTARFLNRRSCCFLTCLVFSCLFVFALQVFNFRRHAKVEST